VGSVEFALVLPLALLVLAAIVDGGMYMIEATAANRAARDAARVGAMTLESPPANGDRIEAASASTARASLTAAGLATDATVTTTWYQQDGTSWLRVEVTCDHRAFFGGVTPFGSQVRRVFRVVTQEQL
jgi:Flp pilus assembly protein TadG